MLPLGLRAADQALFHRLLRNPHTVQPTVQVLNLDHKPVADVSHMLVDGAVNISNDTNVSRSCAVSLYDPKGHIGFGDNDPSDGALFLNNMLRVILSYTSPDLPDRLGWIDVPVFCGPVVGLSRDAYTLSVDALGKEHFGLRAVWEPRSYGGNYYVDLIRWIMRQSGETRFDIPGVRDIPRITGFGPTLWPQSHPWWHAQQLAKGIDRQLFYDGRGVLRLRKRPRNPCWTFADGQHGTITTRPQVAYDVEKVRNLVWVKGRKAKGKERVEGHAQLPGTNPFSRWRLGRGPDNKGGVLLEVIENDHLKTNRECRNRAVARVNDLLTQSVEVTFDAMPVPHLEPDDMVEVDSNDVDQRFRARNFSIPLSAGDAMAVGYTRRMTKGRKARRRPVRSNI